MENLVVYELGHTLILPYKDKALFFKISLRGLLLSKDTNIAMCISFDTSTYQLISISDQEGITLNSHVRLKVQM